MGNMLKKLAAAAAAGLLGISCGGNQTTTDENRDTADLQHKETQSEMVQSLLAEM